MWVNPYDDEELPEEDFAPIGKSSVMECEYCGKITGDVSYRPDPYMNDVGNDPDAMHIACDACNHERAMDI